jgi:glycosyltransferase involved in cell wall biosynthesis
MTTRVAVFRPPHARNGTMFELQATLYSRLAATASLEVTVFSDAARPCALNGIGVVSVRPGLGFLSHRLEKALGFVPYRRAAEALAGFDVIETSDPTLYAYPQVAAEVARRSGARLVCGSSVSLPALKTAAARRAREVMAVAGRILCTTPLAQRRFAALGLLEPDDPRVVVTGHPVDTERFRPARTEGLREVPKVVLTVARLEESKGLREAVEAFAEAPREWAWWIAGTGPLRSSLERSVARRGLGPRVRFLGAVPHEKMPRVYAAAGVLLHLPHSTARWEEYFGAVLIEAMASGLPVVGTRTGAIPWVVGDAGLLVEDEAGSALRWLVENPDLCRELGGRGRANVEARFSLERVGRRWLQAWLG